MKRIIKIILISIGAFVLILTALGIINSWLSSAGYDQEIELTKSDLPIEKNEGVNPSDLAVFPVRQLINKTPEEVELLTGLKVNDSFEGVGGKIMSASIDLDGVSVETAYTLINHPKVKYNGLFFFNIWFDNPVDEDIAWTMTDMPKLDKNQAFSYSLNDRKFIWRDIDPFFQVEAGYKRDKIEFIEAYLLPEEEDAKLY